MRTLLCTLLFAPGCGAYAVDAVCRARCEDDLSCRDECVARTTSRLREARALGCGDAFTSYLSCLDGGDFDRPGCRDEPAALHACGVVDPVGPSACAAQEIFERSLRSACGEPVELVPTEAASSCGAPLGPVEVACRLDCRLEAACAPDDMPSCEQACVSSSPG